MSIVNINRPTPTDIGALIRRLCAAFKRPYKAELDAMVGEWHRSLAERFGRDVLDAAADRCADNDPDFPTLAKFRRHCFDVEQARQPDRGMSLTQQYHAWFADLALAAGEALPCPICGTCVEVTPRGYVTVHDDQQHTRARVSFTNLGDPEWRHLGPWPEWKPPAKRNQRHPSNPAAKPLATIGEVVAKHPVAQAAKARIQQRVSQHPDRVLWEEIPLPEPPPDAVLTAR